MQNYKTGDRVVRTMTGPTYKRGEIATIIMPDTMFKDDYMVSYVDDIGSKIVVNWNCRAFVSEELFNSPLYKVMGEDE